MTQPNHHRHHPLPTPASVTPAQALRWLATGWRIFTANPGVWVVQALILFVILAALGFLPFLGWAAAPVAFPLLVGGLLAGAHAVEQGQPLRIDHLFEGLRRHPGNLLMVGGFHLLGTLIAAAVGGSALFAGGAAAGLGGVGFAAGGLMLGVLVFSLLSALLVMALSFAPALVMLQNVAPLDAMKLSALACLRNLLTFGLLAVMLYVLVWLALIPAGLGMLVLVPVLAGALLAAWRDTFAQAPALAAPLPGDPPPHA